MADHFKRAMQFAHDHGMIFQPVHYNDRVADIFCPVCDWPLIHRETNVEQYAKEPYGCGHCPQSAEPGHPCPDIPSRRSALKRALRERGRHEQT